MKQTLAILAATTALAAPAFAEDLSVLGYNFARSG